ncbi:hypothetical protein HMPREF0972_00853 [Actinomyces sp. oral taxon 848 str. F0332]|nr:hypothetical protein HMPREF0972_00853 [Actinomyces sp. oral taxon 848 str. F0332]
MIDGNPRAADVENDSAESRMLSHDDLSARPHSELLHAQEVAAGKIDMGQPQRFVLGALAKIHCNLTSL